LAYTVSGASRPDGGGEKNDPEAKQMKEEKTNVMRILEQKGIACRAHF